MLRRAAGDSRGRLPIGIVARWVIIGGGEQSGVCGCGQAVRLLAGSRLLPVR
jgi:hypothetical protein